MLVDPGLLFLALCLILGLVAIAIFLLCLPSPGDADGDRFADRPAHGSFGLFRRLLWFLRIRR
ncbi:MAG: hypothetical protein ACK5VI_11265 [Opitutia bacterium]